MTLKSLIVQKEDLDDIIQLITDNQRFFALKKFHTGGTKKVVYRNYYDKSSIFGAFTLNDNNVPVEGIFDINTYKQSKKAINGTYRIEFFSIGSLNGNPCTLVNLFFISRRGIKNKIMDITLTDFDTPKSIIDLDKLLEIFKEKIGSLSNRNYNLELFKVSCIYSLLELLDIQKENLRSDEQVIINGILTSLTSKSSFDRTK